VNQIDREIQYQLDEIFDPWDIYDAMHKNTKSWVQFFDSGVDSPTTAWISDYIEEWDGKKYYCIELDSERTIETGKLIPSLPVYPGTEPGVRPTDWDNDHSLTWDAYCAFTERVLVDSGSGYELIPRGILLTDGRATLASYAYGYHWLDPTPVEIGDYPEDRRLYTINLNTGRICFYKYDAVTKTFKPWYLPIGSMVKVLWSSEHHETTAGQWDEYDLLYPLNDTYRFPLHHDVIDSYKPYTEVFLVTEGDDTVLELVGGDYVFWNLTRTIYMQDPVPAGQWLLVNYTVGNNRYANFFLGDGSTTAFTLSYAYSNVSNLVVYNTEILQQILNQSDTTTAALGIRVPRTDCYLINDTGGTYQGKVWERFGVWEEREWLNVTDTKERGDWIIRETSTCDELVINYNITRDLTAEEEELKIVFKVPSGRWEWGTIGKASAPEDSLGNTMVVAAFKNKLIEFGLGGLDIQSATYGPRIPWIVDTTISPDVIGRYHLYDDWCYERTLDEEAMDSSWPISSSNIITVGGTAVNNVAKYFNDFGQALSGTTVGSGYYAVTCWDKALAARGFYAGKAVTERYGYAVIQTYKDKNGTVIFLVRGWNAQDTYYACKWFDENKFKLQHLNLHVTDLILRIEYKYSDGTLRCIPVISVREYLGTISEKPQHDP